MQIPSPLHVYCVKLSHTKLSAVVVVDAAGSGRLGGAVVSLLASPCASPAASGAPGPKPRSPASTPPPLLQCCHPRARDGDPMLKGLLEAAVRLQKQARMASPCVVFWAVLAWIVRALYY